MANPQQPELRRSGQVPALNPDALEAELEARRRNRRREERRLEDPPPDSDGSPGSDGTDADGRPQDKPDPDAVAEQFGTADE